MNEPSLEQRILEAAEKYEREVMTGAGEPSDDPWFHPHVMDFKALLEEKNAEIERLKAEAAVIFAAHDRVLTGYGELETERDEWKRIAGQYREYERKDTRDALCNPDADCDCPTCEAYDALTGKGEPK